MFASKTILLFDGSAYAALDLAAAVEELGGRVAGPVASIGEAALLVNGAALDGAIVDGELADAPAVATLLAGRNVPFVIQTSMALPAPLAALEGSVPVLARPIAAFAILQHLHASMGQRARRIPIGLGAEPKQV